MAFALVASGCGTKDYKDKPKDDQKQRSEAPPVPGSTTNTKTVANDESGIPTLFRGYAKDGLFWRWTAKQPWSQKIKCEVRDGSQVDYWTVFGYQLIGGAILGILYKSAGSFWLGRPNPQPDAAGGVPVPTPPNPAWAWDRIYVDGERMKQGALRGMFWTGVCANALGPGYLLPVDGFFGRDYHALSTSVALGIAAYVATKPYAAYFLRGGLGGPSDNPDENTSRTRHVIQVLSERFNYAGRKSFTGRIVSPNVIAIGLGAGVFVLVDRSLRQRDANEPVAADECLTPTPTPVKGVAQ